LSQKIGDFTYNTAISIDANALLNDAATVFKATKVDTILVVDQGKPIGMIDIQDLEA